MVDKPLPTDAPATPAQQAFPVPPAAPRRGPGHRGADMRDTVAEMAERAQLISQEAGTKVAHAMRDVISAGAGIAGFAIESARDLVQYMVKRGQMTPEEADKLIREAEAAHEKRPASEKGRPTATKIAADRAVLAKAEAAARAAAQAAAMPPFRPALRPVIPPATTPQSPPTSSAATIAGHTTTKHRATEREKTVPPKAVAKASKVASAKTVAKPLSKSAAKSTTTAKTAMHSSKTTAKSVKLALKLAKPTKKSAKR